MTQAEIQYCIKAILPATIIILTIAILTRIIDYIIAYKKHENSKFNKNIKIPHESKKNINDTNI